MSLLLLLFDEGIYVFRLLKQKNWPKIYENISSLSICLSDDRLINCSCLISPGHLFFWEKSTASEMTAMSPCPEQEKKVQRLLVDRRAKMKKFDNWYCLLLFLRWLVF